MLTAKAEKHLPGQHDQSSHGRRRSVTGAAALARTALDADLNDAQKAAIDRIGGDGAYAINAGLRESGGNASALQQERHRNAVAELDGLMASARTDRELVVHRTMGKAQLPKEIQDLDSDLTGRSWTEHGFISTSVEERNPNYQAVMLRIRVPKGTGAFSHASLDPDEVLIERGLTVRVVADRGSTTGRRMLDVEVVPTPPEPTAKHLPGRHDQSSHGRHSAANRARQAARELEELREALDRAQASTGTSDARWITPDDAMAMREQMLAGQPWTPEQREALNRYVGDSYYGMNGLLRDDQEAIADLDERQKQEATDLIRDAAQGMRPTTEPVKVKRFVGGFATFGLDIDTMTREEIYDAMRGMKGSTLQEPGFMSTSTDPGYGRDTEWSGYVKLELDVPAGAPAAYLNGDVGFPAEKELLLAPGTRFEVLDVVIDPPRNTVKGRVIVE